MIVGFFGVFPRVDMVMVMNPGSGPLSLLTLMEQDLDLIRSNLINVNDAFPSTSAIQGPNLFRVSPYEKLINCNIKK